MVVPNPVPNIAMTTIIEGTDPSSGNTWENMRC